jgi:hypothetical protein
MVKRNGIILILLLALASGAVVGGSLHAGKRGCPMADVPDCCETAHSSGNGPAVSAARLCCALNCTMPGSSAPTGGRLPSPQIFVSLNLSPNLTILTLPVAGRTSRDEIPPDRSGNSHPIYIRHLALLI